MFGKLLRDVPVDAVGTGGSAHPVERAQIASVLIVLRGFAQDAGHSGRGTSACAVGADVSEPNRGAQVVGDQDRVVRDVPKVPARQEAVVVSPQIVDHLVVRDDPAVASAAGVVVGLVASGLAVEDGLAEPELLLEIGDAVIGSEVPCAERHTQRGERGMVLPDLEGWRLFPAEV